MIEPISLPVWLTFALLAGSVCAVWLPARWKVSTIPAWALLFVSAVVAGLLSGCLRWPALAWLGLFVFSTAIAGQPSARPAWRYGGLAATVVLALALAMHKLPGFANPVLFSNVRLSGGAAAFTQYLNFDKGAVGLILLAMLCRRVDSAEARREAMRIAVAATIATCVLVFPIAMLAGYIHPAFKFGTAILVFLFANLFFTCIAEEAFFRGLLQERLSHWLRDRPHGAVAAAGLSALLFGAAHLAGGALYAALATVAGAGYALAYAASRRIESPIAAHIAFNAAHVLFFTYPHL